jgi:hypothetical protein
MKQGWTAWLLHGCQAIVRSRSHAHEKMWQADLLAES